MLLKIKVAKSWTTRPRFGGTVPESSSVCRVLIAVFPLQ
jgi:hypothetical protein